MERDCFRLVKKCHQCQIHSDLIHSPPSELHLMATPWPFVAWGMDVIGPIEPKASNGHRFILVAIGCFTKWVEEITFKAVTKKEVMDFVHSNIIYHFGISRIIITDNAANLNNNLMKEVIEQFKIVHHNSTSYGPKANKTVEAANKNIKKILRRMVQVRLANGQDRINRTGYTGTGPRYRISLPEPGLTGIGFTGNFQMFRPVP
ncbi:uncharacterized protein LOC125851007 [Solanum stenotomum]|uniref:uncharacterized protein LOC125847036 n=1 Tax=Solanum stenotomum TaxID=172797 RepID=UPI0020D016DE|nr:uncharacterized protein LOC125847036 [Solanum stenotomum]XP_049386765.1 uncharacterized protein LOC125851007 [Solanum stenotomum]